MWPVCIFIVWITCFTYSSLEGIEQNTTFVLERNTSAEENVVVGNALKTMDAEGSAEPQISPALIPVKSQSYSDQLATFFSTYNRSMENSGFINTTLHFIRESEQKMEKRIQEVKEIILLLVKNNGTLNLNSTEDDETGISNATMPDVATTPTDVVSTQRQELEINATLQSIIEVEESFHGNLFITEIQKNYTIPDSLETTTPTTPTATPAPTKSLPEKVADWFNSYHNNSNELDVQQEKIWMEFSDFKMEDVVIVPRGFDWVLCSDRANATVEVLTRLIHPSYPLSIKYNADFYLQFLLDAGGTYNASCFASGAKPLSVMYFDELEEPQHAILENFLPTKCFCTDKSSTGDVNATTIPNEL